MLTPAQPGGEELSASTPVSVGQRTAPQNPAWEAPHRGDLQGILNVGEDM